MARRGVVAAAVVVVVLGVGVVVADRVAEATTERRVAQELAVGLRAEGTPEVQLHGFPFLTQLLRGRLEHVTAQVDGATLQDVTLQDIEFDGRDPSTTEPLVLGSTTLTATVPVGTLGSVVSEQVGQDVTVAVRDEALVASGTVLGVDIAITLVPRALDGALGVDVEQADIGGLEVAADDLPDRLATALEQLEVPLDGLPDRLLITGATVVPDGLRLTASGTDVPLDAAVP